MTQVSTTLSDFLFLPSLFSSFSHSHSAPSSRPRPPASPATRASLLLETAEKYRKPREARGQRRRSTLSRIFGPPLTLLITFIRSFGPPRAPVVEKASSRSRENYVITIMSECIRVQCGKYIFIMLLFSRLFVRFG